jgi:hypothetical protein
MGARAVDWARLESVCTERYRGFESRPIRMLFVLRDLYRVIVRLPKMHGNAAWQHSHRVLPISTEVDGSFPERVT